MNPSNLDPAIAEEIRSALNTIIADKVHLSVSQVIIIVALSLFAGFLGAYIKQKGQNLANKDDIQRLTALVEEV